MSDYWDKLIEGDDSLEQFSKKASSLIKLTNAEIQKVIPEGVDHKRFAELMKIVSDSKTSNKEKAEAIRKISGFAEIAANLLTKFV